MKKGHRILLFVIILFSVLLIGAIIFFSMWQRSKVGVGTVDIESFRSLGVPMEAPKETASAGTSSTTFFNSAACWSDTPKLEIIDDTYVLKTILTSGKCTDVGPSYSLYGKSKQHYLCSGSTGFGQFSPNCKDPFLDKIFEDIIENPGSHQRTPLEFTEE